MKKGWIIVGNKLKDLCEYEKEIMEHNTESNLANLIKKLDKLFNKLDEQISLMKEMTKNGGESVTGAKEETGDSKTGIEKA